MKILAAKFVLEANAHVPMKCDGECGVVLWKGSTVTHAAWQCV